MVEALAYTLLGFQIFILSYFSAVNGLYTAFVLISLYHIFKFAILVRKEKVEMMLSKILYRPISIIVPAYNEEKTIVDNLRSLLSLHYPEFELVVVNDGSTDRTLEKIKEAFRLVRLDRPIRRVLKHREIKNIYVSLDYPNLIVVDKENGGKADALNCGINVSSYPLFCCIDADSILEETALLRASRIFVEDRHVIATGGSVRVLNGSVVKDGKVVEIRSPKKWIETFQVIEYVRGFLTGRTAWNIFNSLLIISGAFGIFRKDMVMDVGGYRKTVGEDMDLVVRLHRHCIDKGIPYKILFIRDPICWTQVPSDVKSLLSQRNRWHRGLIDSLWHSRVMFLNPKYRWIGLFGFPYFFFVEALGPTVEFIGYLSVVLFYLTGLLSREFALLFFLVAFLWGSLISMGSILLDNLMYRRYGRLREPHRKATRKKRRANSLERSPVR
jgi:cellulose synthase/poly-beta-1,6-N-acetylglucosamine synthase-like glycosyltransferase